MADKPFKQNRLWKQCLTSVGFQQ